MDKNQILKRIYHNSFNLLCDISAIKEIDKEIGVTLLTLQNSLETYLPKITRALKNDEEQKATI